MMKPIVKTLLITIALVLASCESKPTFQVTHYAYEIVERDSLYFVKVIFDRVDTVSGSIADGIVIKFNNMFDGYNDSLIQFKDNQIIPKSVGVSKIRLHFPNGEVDSFKVNITKAKGRLVLSKPLPA